ARVSGVVLALQTLDDLAVRLNLNRELEKLRPEIQRQMPEKGGVLVVYLVARQKERGMSLPRHSYLVRARVGAAGATEDEAWVKFRKENATPTVGPATPGARPMGPLELQDREAQFLDYDYEWLKYWIAAPTPPPVAPDPAPVNQARERAANLLR